MKKIIRSITFFVILFALVELSMFILIPKGNSSKYNFIERGANEVLQENKGEFQILIVGDSLATSSINPLQIWNKYGYTSYVLDQTDFSMNDIYDNLVKSIDYQKPKIVILESNVLFNDHKENNWYENFNNKIMNLVPVYKYHNNWKKLLSDGVIKTDIYKGFNLIFETLPSTNESYMINTYELEEISENNIESLQNIIRLCDRNNISFVIISTPSQKLFDYSKRTSLIRLSNQLKFTYMDLNLGNPLGVNWTKDTYDEGYHLNYLGAYKVTKHISQYLYNTNLLEDYRNNEKYASWKDAYEQYEKDCEAILG